MNNFSSFNQIRNQIINTYIPVGRNIPVDFSVRPIEKKSESYDFQLVYLDYVGNQRRLFTCIISEEIFGKELINIETRSRDLLKGLDLSFAPSTLAEQLIAERMRVSKEGVTFYDFDFNTDSLVFNYDGVTYHAFLKSNGEWSIPDSVNISNAIDLKRNHVNWRIFSYLKDNNVYATNLLTKESVQLTFNVDPHLASGSTHFIIQEEFDRYEGMWWRPIEGDDIKFHLLIEEYDEKMVDEFTIPDYSNGFKTEVYRYPRPGKKNAQSNLKVLKIGLDPVSQKLTLLATLELSSSLMTLFPQCEYLTNAGWTPNGKFIWVEMTDRLQNVKSTYLLPLECFQPPSSRRPCDVNYAILFNKEENLQFWVPNNVNTRFLNSSKHIKTHEDSEDIVVCSAIVGMVTSGYNHLYLVNKYWKVPQASATRGDFVVIDSEVDSIVPLTSGSWQVDKEKVWVNEQDHLVYFMANKDDTISNYMYRVNYKNLKASEYSVKQITNQDTNIYLKPGNDWAVVVTSSLLQDHQVHLMNVKHADIYSSDGKVRLDALPSSLSLDRGVDVTINNIKLLKYDIVDDTGSSIPLYGVLCTPKSSQPKRWPTIHYVYGGPGVQIVRNSYLRHFFNLAQMFNQFGYAFLMCDGRGSTGRGLAFEGHIKNKMGTVELADQIFFLKKAAEDTGLIDLGRVGIHGSSYGGYLTIMALLQHSDVYKCGFSCSPVVDFRFYDTAYTERYLGIPDLNTEVYNRACTLTYLNGLPTDCCRLTVAHGGQDENVHFLHTAHLMEQASSMGLDIRLLFYPTSRHRIKRREHLDTNLILFMNTHLSH